MGVTGHALLFFSVLVFNTEFVRSQESDCEVIANCNGQVTWKDWPGKKQTELAGQLHQAIGYDYYEGESHHSQQYSGPNLHHYRNTMMWKDGKEYCNYFGERLCKASELCVYGKNGRKFLFEVIPGDNWVPVEDAFNEWVEIGDSHLRTCFVHGPNYGPPPWGITAVAAPHKGFIYCCPGPDDSPTETTVKYEYIGSLATYDSSLDHCKGQDLRLCSSAEVCPKDSPSFGRVSGDMWVAVNDKYNEWIQIGDAYGSEKCKVHGELTWGAGFGTRTDRSEVEYVGYVYCCG